MSINLRKIDLNLLVIFEALYSTGSTSRAAERLGMSQPAVSNALARLRDLIGDPLFVREARGLKPTGKSHEIIGPVRDALTVIGRQFVAADTIDLATYKRLFRIIMADPYEPILMPSIIRTIAAHAPGIEIECVPATAQYVDDIRDGSIDLACFAFPTDTSDIVAKALCPVDFVVISRRDHPEIRKPLDVETLRRLPQISVSRELRGLTGIDKNLIASGTHRRVPYMAAKIWSIPPMVQRTDLIGFLPRLFVNEIADNFELDVHEVPFAMPEQHAFLLWHVNSESDPGHKWLREQMLQALGARIDGQ
jgi:DNA-binding transcriptional LysR family regulator